MSVILYPFMLLAAAGLFLSAVVHALALAGGAAPGGDLVWTLHGGIFVVWLPTVLIAVRATRHAARKDLWKVVLAGCPAWMRGALYGLFAYAVVNFILSMLAATRGPHAGGDVAPSTLRAFSGHWMVFYGAAFATLYSVIHAPALLRARRCPRGHGVAPTARYCPECGSEMPGEPKRG